VNNHELESKMRAMASTLAPNESQRDTSGARMQRTVYEMQEQDRNPLMVKLGDASIASPFTARRTSIECVLAVLRQGRCTLVTTLQVYKILALNCLVSAYMMSVLYVMGLKQGDTQMTCMGLVVAGFFFCLSRCVSSAYVFSCLRVMFSCEWPVCRAKPLQELSSQRPPSSVFALSTMLSILGQFVVHLTCLRMATALCHSREGTDMLMTPDAEFRPNVVNTVIFLLSACMQVTTGAILSLEFSCTRATTRQVNTFVVNYRGRPFMEGLHENVALWRGAQLCYLVLLMAAMEWFQPLNAALELSRLPSTSFR
jgi:cation-transporting ATPase 13A1